MNHRRLLPSAVLAMLGWSAPCAMADTMPPLDTIPFVEIESPAGPASQAPGLVSGKDAIYLTWIEAPAGGVPVLKMSRHDAAGWSAARTIVSDPKMMVNWADVPKLLALDDGTLIVSWLRRSGDAAGAYDVEVLSSADGGRHLDFTWSAVSRQGPGRAWLRFASAACRHRFLDRLAGRAQLRKAEARSGVRRPWTRGRHRIARGAVA